MNHLDHLKQAYNETEDRFYSNPSVLLDKKLYRLKQQIKKETLKKLFIIK
jgi:septation ring formation regulator EzrA